MDQQEYCAYWSRSDGYIHCLDCIKCGDCAFYDFLTRFDPLDPQGDVYDISLEYCDNFVVTG